MKEILEVNLSRIKEIVDLSREVRSRKIVSSKECIC